MIYKINKSIQECLHSFKYAANGLQYVTSRENNFKYHVLATSFVTVLGVFFHFSIVSWIIIILLIGFVYVTEILNTAIEKILDKFFPAYDSEVGLIKDIAAGAVLIASLVAFFIGSIIMFIEIQSALK